MSLVLNSSGGGSVTLQEPVTASNLTLTLPDATGSLITESMVLLGTLTTTSGTTQTLSGLNLTGYKSLYIAFNNVSLAGTTNSQLQLNSIQISIALSNGANGFNGIMLVDLVSGAFFSAIDQFPISTSTWSITLNGRVGRIGITNASTSITLGTAGTLAFDNGAVYFYGVK
jgi:hypothetical protein